MDERTTDERNEAGAGVFDDLDEALRLLIDRSGLTLTEASRRLGLSHGALQNYLSHPLPRSIRTLGRLLSESLGMTVIDLVEALITVKRRREGPDPLTEEALKRATKIFLLSLDVTDAPATASPTEESASEAEGEPDADPEPDRDSSPDPSSDSNPESNPDS